MCNCSQPTGLCQRFFSSVISEDLEVSLVSESVLSVLNKVLLSVTNGRLLTLNTHFIMFSRKEIECKRLKVRQKAQRHFSAEHLHTALQITEVLSHK